MFMLLLCAITIFAHTFFNPLRVADFSAHLSRATEEFSQNNQNLTEQSLDSILAVIHLAYKKNDS